MDKAIGWNSVAAASWILLTVKVNVNCAEEGGGGGFGTDAIIGIVVASVCVLLIVIGAVIAYIVCRNRRQAAKNQATPNPTASDPHSGGQALPADIPIEAVNRVPPPSYAPRSRQSQRLQRPTRRTTSGTTSLSPPPPPSYAAAVSGAPTAAIATIDLSYGEAPPEYRSRVGLNSSVGDIAQLDNVPRTISVDSFIEYPSMRNIVETSSRSSLQGTDSRHASQSDRSSAGPSVRAGRLSGAAGDSARGDSVESRSNRSDDATSPSNLRQTHRAMSSSSSALYDPRMSIPEGGLQRRVRRTRHQQQQQQQSSDGGGRVTSTASIVMNTEMNRSCPSLVSDDTNNPSSSHGNGGESRPYPAKQGGHRRHRATETYSPSSSTSAPDAAAIQKRRRYRSKDGSAKTQRLSTSTEYSGDLENQFQYSGRGQAYGADTSASSLPSLSSQPVTRFKVAGTCDV